MIARAESSPGTQRLKNVRMDEEEALQMNVRDRIPQSLQREFLAKALQLSHSEILEPYQTQRFN